MKIKEVASYRNRLDVQFKRGASLAKDPELQAQWARYLCILCSGFLEIAVQAIFSEYTRNKASPDISAFVAAQLDKFQNPKMEKILEVARAFNPDWEENLRAATDGELKDAIDSIVANRHLIAHGSNVGITYGTISQYYQRAAKVVELLADECMVKI